MNKYPVSVYQASPQRAYANISRLKTYANATNSEVANDFPLGTKVYFTQPLQRRSEYMGGYDTRFWWEPSGGNNSKLFEGIVVGVRSYSAGIHDEEDSSYISQNTFPVLLVAFSLYRKPVPVVPWLTYESEEEFQSCKKYG